MVDQRKRILAVSLWTLDLALTAASFFLAYRVRLSLGSLFILEGHSVEAVRDYLWLLAVILPTWAILLPAFKVYSQLTLQPLGMIVRLTKAIGVAWLAMAAIQFFVNPTAPARLILLFTLAINYAFLVSYRIFFVRFHKALGERHVAIIGAGEEAREFARKIEDNSQWGFKSKGIFSPSGARALLEKGGVDELVVVATSREDLDEFTEIFRLCEELGVTATVVINFFPQTSSRLELHHLDRFSLLSFSTTPSNQALLLVRRVMDIAITLMAAAPAAAIVAISGILIKLTSPGPILFSQQRCGLNGRPFTMYKLRSMVDNAEQLRVELEALNEMDGPVFKSSRDPRVTAIGRIIRRFSIDEIPQLYNVLRGDMSLVGPRPPLPEEVARYERWQRRRLSMKPGLTCLWQVSGRNKVGFQDWMKLDLRYIDNWSLLLDLKILLKTVPVVLLGRGAK
jgi:exopolysaccharide biosynthesis polyprenyl glycosylphosphotransferase